MDSWDASEAPGELPDGRPADPKGSSGRGRFAAGTPEDVAALYTWANLQGARYRDFSASRRRYREQIRNQAEEGATSPEPVQEAQRETPREEPMVPRPRPAGATLEERQRGGSAIRWAAGRRGWESSSRSVSRDQVGGRQRQEPREQRVTQREEQERVTDAAQAEARMGRFDEADQAEKRAQARSAMDWRAHREFAEVSDDPMYRGSANLSEGGWERMETAPAGVDRTFASALRAMEAEARRGSGRVPVWTPEPEEEHAELEGPAWLYGAPHEPVRSRITVGRNVERPVEAAVRSTAADHWPQRGRERTQNPPTPPRETRVSGMVVRKAPMLVLFSLAGGVGKTSLLATVGRALSASGERVVLGDAAAFSLLPFYFGGDELRAGEVRGFAPPEGSADAPVLMVNYDVRPAANDAREQRHMVTEILRNGAECNRILLDIPLGADWLMRRLATLQPTVLVPLLADMSSVISLDAVEQYFEQFEDEDGNPVRPFYLLNQFDAGVKLHRDVREILRSLLGERLLHCVVRRSEAVSEALAEGMTVADYAPESPVARDYFDVAAWLRTASPAATLGARLAQSGVRSSRG